jgi:hypothetical protein
MNKVLRLLGLIALAASLTSGRKPKSIEVAPEKSAEGRTAPVFIVPPGSHYKLPKTGYARSRNSHASMALTIEQRSLGAVTGPFAEIPPWLSELNRWRRIAGLNIVSDSTSLSYGSEQHARYLVSGAPAGVAGFRAYDRSIGPAAHVEDSRKPSYTAIGAAAAIGGALVPEIIQGADVAWEGKSPADDIDELIQAPFHRLSLLAPWAQVGGYGSFGEYPQRAASLALRGPLDAPQDGHPVEFPPANMTIPMGAMRGSEWPNPIAECEGYAQPVGLPITLQTGHRLLLRSYSLQDETSGEALAACGFDTASYRNPDATQQKCGRELLIAYGAVVLVPRYPLSFAHRYSVSMRTSRGSFEWAFSLKQTTPVETAQSERAAAKHAAATP